MHCWGWSGAVCSNVNYFASQCLRAVFYKQTLTYSKWCCVSLPPPRQIIPEWLNKVAYTRGQLRSEGGRAKVHGLGGQMDHRKARDKYQIQESRRKQRWPGVSIKKNHVAERSLLWGSVVESYSPDEKHVRVFMGYWMESSSARSY